MIDKKILGVTVGVVLTLVFANVSQSVNASSNGLKVYVYVHGAADNAVGNTAISCELISIMLGVTKK